MNKEEKKTLVISAFPGTGKTYLSKLVDALDSDSSSFSWMPGTKIKNPEFPFNYITHIKDNIGKYDFIFVSSHHTVRTAMVQYGIDFLSAYPDHSLKNEYLLRYKERGGDDEFISMMFNNWDSFIDSMLDLQVMPPLILNKGEYLADYFLLNSDKDVQKCDASKAPSTDEPLVNNNPENKLPVIDWERLVYEIPSFFRPCSGGNGFFDASEEVIDWLKTHLHKYIK